jgi:septal ring factor EnvC (AmiA/AmiB activator)
METIKNIWTKISVVLVTFVGLFWVLLRRKNKETEQLKMQIETTHTQRKADLLESEVKQKLSEVSMSERELKETQAALIKLEERRKEIEKKQQTLTDPKEIEKYWNK